jgi:hypothetical protein
MKPRPSTRRSWCILAFLQLAALVPVFDPRWAFGRVNSHAPC